VLSGAVLISVSRKCGEWLVYAEPVTNIRLVHSLPCVAADHSMICIAQG